MVAVRLLSFISSFAEPLTIMTCSVGVCQCQGIKQPAVPLKTITDGPLEGSPLSTAMVVHEGSPAIGANLFSDNLWNTPISSAWVMNRHMTAAATNLIASFPRININPVYPGDGSVGTRHFGAAWRHSSFAVPQRRCRWLQSASVPLRVAKDRSVGQS